MQKERLLISLESAIKEIVRETVSEMVSSHTEPIPITIEEAASICNVDRSVIDSLVHDAPKNGFPAARLGRKTVRIDKVALNLWLMGGGLNGKYN